MTKNELDVSMNKLSIAQDLYNNAEHTKNVYDSFKGFVREAIGKAGRFEIRTVCCYPVEIPLTDDVKRALDIIEDVLRRQAEEASKAFEEFKGI